MRKGHTKINEQINKYLYNWILQHPQVLQSPIANDCLEASIDSTLNNSWFKKIPQVYVRELYNSMVSTVEEGGLKEASNVDNNIIISDSTLQSILPPQLKNMSDRYEVMCSCECCISSKSIHSSLLSWLDRYLSKINDISQNAQNTRSGEMDNHLFETYKNSMTPHGRHIYATAAAMAMDTMCAYPPSQHELIHCKCVFLLLFQLPTY